MRKIIVVLVVLLASGLLSSTASALSTEVTDPNDISVFVDDEYLEFKTKPYNEAGTVMVPFRPIFEKLGLVVLWNSETRTVTGSKGGLTIKLQVGSQKATVNGEVKILVVAPKNVNGSVFIPLRFVGESAEREVSWNSYWKQVVIADTAEQINQVLSMNAVFLSLEDEKGLLTTYKPDSPGYTYAVGTIIPHDFQQYDLQYSTPQIESIEQDGEYMAVIASQVITKMDDSDYYDQTSSTRYSFIKENGAWKIVGYSALWIRYDSTHIYPEQPITLTAEEQKAITELIDRRIQYANALDVDGINTVYAEENEGSEDSLLDFLMSYDVVEAVDDIQFISNGEGEAIVKVTIFIDYMDDEFYDAYADYYMFCKKDSNGEWKIANVELLQDTYLWE